MPPTAILLMKPCISNSMRRPLLNRWILPLLALSALTPAALSDISVPAYFSEHMMLQADAPAPVWGWADPGETVSATFAGQTQTAQADEKGEWRVTFSALKPGANGPLTLNGKNTLTIQDVLAGEVWLASGQSNMHINLLQSHRGPGVAEALATSADPWVRQFTVIRNDKAKSAKDLAGFWRVANKENLTCDRVHGDSAVAYFFARETRRRLNQPVGVLHASIGATPIETWSKGGSGFEKMVKPMAPYGIRGFLWYQGESNVHRFTGSRYTSLFTETVASWRSTWGRGDLPFLYVQIAPNRYSTKNAAPSNGRPISPLELPLFWEAQTAALKTIPHSGMAVIHDSITDLDNIHPGNASRCSPPAKSTATRASWPPARSSNQHSLRGRRSASGSPRPAPDWPRAAALRQTDSRSRARTVSSCPPRSLSKKTARSCARPRSPSPWPCGSRGTKKPAPIS
jgi:sialate O-acetylesterase